MEDTKFHHLRFLSGKMWFIFGTNCLFDGITIFKFEAKLCFWAQNVEVCWCSVCFYFVCFRFGGRFVIYFFSSSRLYVCCGESVDSCSHRFCHLFAVYLVRCVYLFIYLCALHKYSFRALPIFFALNHSLHCLLFYSPKPSHTNRILIHFLFFDFMSFFSHFIL